MVTIADAMRNAEVNDVFDVECCIPNAQHILSIKNTMSVYEDTYCKVELLPSAHNGIYVVYTKTLKEQR